MPASVSLDRALSELEAERKLVVDEKKKSFALLGGGAVIICLGLLLPPILTPAAIIGILVFITGCYFYYGSTNKFDDYRYGFKKNIVTALLQSVDPNLNFDANSGILEVEFISSQLFKQQPDRYSSQDEVTGTAGKTSFKFSEVHAEYKTETHSKNGRQEHWHEIFKGIVFCADFNKNFNGVTIVRPKEIGSMLGAWLSDKIPIFSSGKEVVKLESPDFEKSFMTYSTDQVEARYILTPAMMVRLCELNGKSSDTISVSFIYSKVYIAFPSDRDYFEPPLYSSLIDAKTITEDLNVIKFMYGIIRELDLNTRIWGKG